MAAALCVAYALVVTFGGWQYVRKMHEVGILMQDLPIEQWIPRVVVPLGFALLALRFVNPTQIVARSKTQGAH